MNPKNQAMQASLKEEKGWETSKHLFYWMEQQTMA